jgi:signal peptidase II
MFLEFRQQTKGAGYKPAPARIQNQHIKMKIKTKFLFLFSSLVVLDQFAKYTFSVSICNQNIAWNIPIAPAIFYFVWIVIIVILIYAFLNAKIIGQKYFLILIFSGAFSNIIDRVRLGCVVDYIDLKFFPVFNLADAYITLGAILLLALVLKSKCPQRS